MEVGAVKQAFNNEVILLKKKLNQAKIQIIHKLTRKAKQLAEKKAPEPLKEKLKRKAEAAVNEVLIIKKIKPKDIAKFIVTHKGELNSFLNNPTVDNDKACARLLLHKALQDKYMFIRGRFSNVAIKDLFMSRLERRKIKKEEKEKQKNKKKAKGNKVVNSEGDWDVEEVNGKSKLSETNMDDNELSDGNNDDDNVMSDGDDDSEHNQVGSRSEEEEENAHGEKSDESDDENESKLNMAVADQEETENSNSETEVSKDDKEASSLPKPTTVKSSLGKHDETQINTKQRHLQDSNIKPIEKNKKKPEQKQKEINKAKNFNEKIMQRKLKKDRDESVVANKIVDPFFITSSGENYMSVVEPRDPDKVKAEHKQGNRKLRRAAMFGHVPHIKPRRNYNSHGDDKRFSQNSYDNVNKGKFNNRQKKYDRHTSKNDFIDRRASNNEFIDRRASNNNNITPEKLHPSWEAKKKKSGILPYEGKKIVFD